MSGPRDLLPGGPLEPAFWWPEELQDEREPDRPIASWRRVLAVGLVVALIVWWI